MSVNRATPLWRLIGIGAVLTAFLVLMIVPRAMVIADGKEVTFPIRPVDPRSLFRGDYIILRFAFSRIDMTDEVETDEGLKKRDKVFVTLAPTTDDEGLPDWRAVSVSRSRPQGELPSDHILLKGEIDWTVEPQTQTPRGDPWPDGKPRPGALEIDYGLESYFVPEGEGLEIERDRNTKRLEVVVAVDGKGNAVIRALKVDGAIALEESLF